MYSQLLPNCMVSTEDTCYNFALQLCGMHESPSDKRLSRSTINKKTPDCKEVRTNKVMVKTVSTTGAAKDAGKQYTLVVPVRGRPAVHPTLEDSGSHRNSTPSEDAVVS